MVGREEGTGGGSDRDKIKVFRDVGAATKIIFKPSVPRTSSILPQICVPARTRETRTLPGCTRLFWCCYRVDVETTLPPPHLSHRHHILVIVRTNAKLLSVKTIWWDGPGSVCSRQTDRDTDLDVSLFTITRFQKRIRNMFGLLI